DMIISGGLNVYPAEIEKVVASHPSVGECAVVATPDERFGEVGLAYVVPQGGGELDLEEVRAFATEQLSTYKLPKHWVMREAPLAPRGRRRGGGGGRTRGRWRGARGRRRRRHRRRRSGRPARCGRGRPSRASRRASGCGRGRPLRRRAGPPRLPRPDRRPWR